MKFIKLMKLLIPLFIFLNSALANNLENKDLNLVGRFNYLKTEDSRNLYGHNFYFSIQKEDKTIMAYPTIIKDKKLAKLIKQNLQQSFHINARLLKNKIVIKEKTYTAAILNLNKAKIINLAALESKFNKKDKPNGKYDPQGINISKKVTIMDPHPENQGITVKHVNDRLTNTAIFAGAAAILGSFFIK